MKTIEYKIEEDTTVYFALKKLGYSENLIKNLKKQMGQIKINGQDCNVREKVKKGDVLTLTFLETALPIAAADIPLSIVYEDCDILVLNKQSGLAVLPTVSHYHTSLFSALKFHFGEDFPCHIVTRLDRDTSGLMLIAKHSLAHSLLNQNLKENVTRKYLALVHGLLIQDGTIDAPIARAEVGMKRLISQNGQHAVTIYRVLKNFEDTTLLEAELRTGRTHQIRVHFAHLNHPLCGDKLYGIPDGFPRQTLHSCALTFIHPITGKNLHFESYDADFIDK